MNMDVLAVNGCRQAAITAAPERAAMNMTAVLEGTLMMALLGLSVLPSEAFKVWLA